MQAGGQEFDSPHLHQRNRVPKGTLFNYERESNSKGARGVKKNSIGYCFLGEWCEDGYCTQSVRSSSRADYEVICIDSSSPPKKNGYFGAIAVLLFFP